MTRNHTWRCTRRIAAIVPLLLLAALNGGLHAGPQSAEPEYEGKPLTYWMACVTDEPCDAVLAALLSIGDPVVRPLQEAAAGHPDRRSRRSAVSYLIILSDFAHPNAAARRALVGLVANRRAALEVRLRLARIVVSRRYPADSSLPVILDVLSDVTADLGEYAEESPARTAFWLIDRIGPDAAPAVPHLVRALSSMDSRLRLEACEALEVIGRSTPAVIEALEGALDDPYYDVVEAAARALETLRNDP